VTAGDAAQTGRNIRELTKVGECEIDELVLSCTRSRPVVELRADYETTVRACCPA